MKTVTINSSIAKKGIFFALVLSSMALVSCEDKSVGPKPPTEIFADDDPPKDTNPPK